MKHKNLHIVIGVILAVAAVAAIRVGLFGSREVLDDPCYHYRVAEQGWSTFAAKTFPAMTASAWTSCFADKELGYHLLLGAIQPVGEFFGIPEYPFHWPVIFFAALVVAAFAWACVHFKLKYGWFFIPMLVVCEPIFCYRLMLLRPHVLAIALMLAGCVVFDSLKGWRDGWRAAALTAVFALCYSNPHFVLLPLGAFALAHFVYDKRRGTAILVYGLAGIIFGVLLHPAFPNNLIIWKIQCVDVVHQMLSPLDNSHIAIGTEAKLSGWHNLWLLKCAALLFALNIALAAAGFYRRGRALLQTDLLAMLLLGAVTAAGCVVAFRTVEYALPFNLLLCGMLLSRLELNWEPAARNLSLAIVLAAAAAFSWSYNRIDPRDPNFGGAPGTVGKFVRARYPAGTLIANLNWSDFPMLYYALPEYRFLYGMDPFFAYSVIPEQYRKIHGFLWRPEYYLPAAELIDMTGASLFFVHSDEDTVTKLRRIGGNVVFRDNYDVLIEFPAAAAKP